MRWDTLSADREAERTLPGYSDPARVRTFEAPEALDTRFYEVRGKSALNRVPKASRMPFRWTINPYRGCTHACTYCLAGDTPISMADGRTLPLADVRVGDEIYGTVRSGPYRRYTPTRVLAHWTTRKAAYRITLEDGTELVASGDHRFLTSRGWKHVTGAEQGRRRRPHLTLNDKLMGIGALPPPPDDTPEYRSGYLCGLIRGGGHIGSYSYSRPGRAHGDVHRFRLALTDLEALRRARWYLSAAGALTDEFRFQEASATTRSLTAIRAQSRDTVSRIRRLVAWPGRASAEWCKGFLAGIFDAEGSLGNGIVRIANTDQEIIDWTTWCLRRLDFGFVIEGSRKRPLQYIRLHGGLARQLRFLHTVDPAITRKRTIAGTAIKSTARLGVVSVEPLGIRRRLFDITTGTGDFIASGVVSHNCFARPTHTYLDFNAREDFEREIVVKVNAPEVLRAELARPSWRREHVALGTNTDPYQWVEGRYKLMPEIWAALREADTPCSVLTKSPLLLRDLALMQELAERVGFTANLSVPTLDERTWRATEPRTPNPRARLEAVAELNRAGVPTGILIAPLMPGVNDSPEQVDRILELATEAGAVSIAGIALHLRGEVRGIFFDWLRAHRPDLVPRYEQLYRRGAYAPKEERERIARLARSKPGARRLIGRADSAPARTDPGGPPPRRDQTEPEPQQTALF